MVKKYSDKELVNIAKKYSNEFTTTRDWDIFAKSNNLPGAHQFKQRFGSWNKAKEKCEIMLLNNEQTMDIQKQQILEQLLPYKHLITTAKEWNEIAERENLPKSYAIIRCFGKWNDFKTALGIHLDEISLKKKAQYIEIAKKHLDEFAKSADSWKSFAKANNLPSTNTYIENFGSWRNAQIAAGVNSEEISAQTKRYTKEYLIKVAKGNISHFKHTSEWIRFAKENNLPSVYAYISAFGNMAEAKKQIGITDAPTRKNYEEEELIQIAQENISEFTTEKNWDAFARKNSLPQSRVFANAFFSWNQAKQYINDLHINKD